MLTLMEGGTMDVWYRKLLKWTRKNDGIDGIRGRFSPGSGLNILSPHIVHLKQVEC